MNAHPLAPQIAAEVVTALHFSWIAYVVVGAFIFNHHRWWRRVHLGAMAYSMAIVIFNSVCPLTYVEQHFRLQSGGVSYTGSFIGHYLERLVYWEISREALVGMTAALLAWTLFRFFHFCDSDR